MSIQAVMVSNPKGKLLFYRNYGSVAHNIFEDLAFSLPQSMKKDAQHTFVLHGQYRLIYLPIEKVFMSLVTDQNSNILEDIESVAQMKEVITSIIGSQADESAIFEHYVDLALAFDEMVNLNSRNAISKTQIAALLEMESTNEKLFNAMIESKEKEAMRKAEEEVKKIERAQKVQELVNKELKEIDKTIREFSGKIGGPSEDKHGYAKSKPKLSDANEEDAPENALQANVTRKGIQLGKKPEKKAQIIDRKRPGKESAKKDEENFAALQEETAQIKFNPLNEEIRLIIDEKISGEIGLSGYYSRFEVKGSLGLIIENPEIERFEIATRNQANLRHLNVKLPPNFDRAAWAKGLLCLKSKTSSLPKRTLVETLKYNLVFNTFDETVPFTFSIWLSGPQVSFEIEFNSNQQFFTRVTNLAVHFRKLYGNDFTVSETDNSHFDKNAKYLIWQIPRLDESSSNASIIIDFEEKVTEDEIFPADIEMSSEQTIFDFEITKVVADENREVRYSLAKSLKAKDFRIA